MMSGYDFVASDVGTSKQHDARCNQPSETEGGLNRAWLGGGVEIFQGDYSPMGWIDKPPTRTFNARRFYALRQAICLLQCEQSHWSMRVQNSDPLQFTCCERGLPVV